MRNSLKVAKWEIKKNIKNKSFLISLFLTPLMFILFSTLPSLFDNFKSEPKPVNVYISDELHIWNDIQKTAKALDWKIKKTTKSETEMLKHLNEAENTVYIPLTKTSLAQGIIPIYQSEDMSDDFMEKVNVLKQPLRQFQIEQMGLTAEQMKLISQGIHFKAMSATEANHPTESKQESSIAPLKRIVPGLAAGIIFFSIVLTGMMIFQSASQEKKEKVAEIILSSLTPADLMQGKIIGYFVLGLTQVLVWLSFAIPLIIWKIDIPVLEYLFVPEFLLFLLIAIAGYLLFAAIFVGLGATVEDMTTAGNFQSLVFMLPFLPFVLISPIMSDPDGIVAQVSSFIPFTSPSVLLIRLSILDEWPWIEIIISLIILLASIWLFMKLAGKIFKVGILMYGKNATPKEIWKWMRAH
ncbi:ABC transporter permease [Bacillus xiapuensis]|uniref:ABC transporter permease n=1 Tax=Bacillus xiapuensis TaxID=2014075 RepID=UPI000C2332DB|nr:ABC transporter permease [Bacillus xiapuensis]